jgi:WD40 repeat protein
MVEPLNLDTPGDVLTFEVSMNTHSVNLSMDLSTLAIMNTDNGNSVQAVSWDGGTEGGHHVSGNLSFPATNNGKPILDGAKELTLTIKDVDAPERVFTWELSQ